jgi:hypothetical protein
MGPGRAITPRGRPPDWQLAAERQARRASPSYLRRSAPPHGRRREGEAGTRDLCHRAERHRVISPRLQSAGGIHLSLPGRSEPQRGAGPHQQLAQVRGPYFRHRLVEAQPSQVGAGGFRPRQFGAIRLEQVAKITVGMSGFVVPSRNRDHRYLQELRPLPRSALVRPEVGEAGLLLSLSKGYLKRLPLAGLSVASHLHPLAKALVPPEQDSARRRVHDKGRRRQVEPK